jgi:hypothetical protein
MNNVRPVLQDFDQTYPRTPFLYMFEHAAYPAEKNCPSPSFPMANRPRDLVADQESAGADVNDCRGSRKICSS